MRLAMGLAVAALLGLSAGALVPRAWFTEVPKGGDDVFCVHWLDLGAESKATVINSKLLEYSWGFHDSAAVEDCLLKYVLARTEAISAACKRRNDFDAGITIGTIFAAGRFQCRAR